MTQYYQLTGTHDEYVNAYRYTAKVKRLDPLQIVNVPSMLVRVGYGVLSFCKYDCSGQYSWHDPVEKTISAPVPGVVYTVVPPWHNAWLRVAGDHQYQCGNTTFTVRRYRAIWSTRVPNVCVGNPYSGGI